MKVKTKEEWLDTAAPDGAPQGYCESDTKDPHGFYYESGPYRIELRKPDSPAICRGSLRDGLGRQHAAPRRGSADTRACDKARHTRARFPSK